MISPGATLGASVMSTRPPSSRMTLAAADGAVRGRAAGEVDVVDGGVAGAVLVEAGAVDRARDHDPLALGGDVDRVAGLHREVVGEVAQDDERAAVERDALAGAVGLAALDEGVAGVGPRQQAAGAVDDGAHGLPLAEGERDGDSRGAEPAVSTRLSGPAAVAAARPAATAPCTGHRALDLGGAGEEELVLVLQRHRAQRAVGRRRELARLDPVAAHAPRERHPLLRARLARHAAGRSMRSPSVCPSWSS